MPDSDVVATILITLTFQRCRPFYFLFDGSVVIGNALFQYRNLSFIT